MKAINVRHPGQVRLAGVELDVQKALKLDNPQDLYVLNVPEHLTNDARARLRASWEDASGIKDGRLVILENGATLEKISPGIEHLAMVMHRDGIINYQEARALLGLPEVSTTVDECHTGVNLPLHKVGDSFREVGQGIEAFKKRAVTVDQFKRAIFGRSKPRRRRLLWWNGLGVGVGKGCAGCGRGIGVAMRWLNGQTGRVYVDR